VLGGEGPAAVKELRLTDRELQALIAPALLARLKAAGFVTAHSEGAQPVGFAFPITLNLAGEVTLHRSDEGVWTLTQLSDGDLAERTEFAQRAHVEAVGHTVADLTKG
jgi:hypothetical protein